MPSPYLKNLAKETGKSLNDLEKYWDKAKKIASEEMGVSENDFTDKQWKYTVGIVKNMAGINENRMDVKSFVESTLSIDEFIESTMTSGDFPKLQKDQVIKKDEEEEETEIVQEAKKDGIEPDGTGPHGKGNGPGKGKADGTGLKKDDEESTIEEQIEDQGLYSINSPKELKIAGNDIKKGDKLIVQNEYDDVDGAYKVEIRIPNTNLSTWIRFTSRQEALKYNWVK